MARAISEAEDPCAILYGPSESEQEDRFGDFASAWTISTYPRIPDFGRSGDPICDRFFSQVSLTHVHTECGRGTNVACVALPTIFSHCVG